MKKQKIAVIAAVAMIGILCIVICFMNGKTKSEGTGYSSVAGDNPGDKDSDSDFMGGKQKDSVKAPSEGTDTSSPDDKSNKAGKGKKIKLVDQVIQHGRISKKTNKKLMDSITSGKNVVILDCREVQTPEKMKYYQMTETNLHSRDIRKKLKSWLDGAVKDNPGHISYHPYWLPDDYYEELYETEENPSFTSAEQPYEAIIPSGTNSLLLTKNFYDTRIRTENRFLLTQKRAVNKTKKFMKKILSGLELGCEAAPEKSWEILGYKMGGGGNGPAVPYQNVPYQNKVQEKYYAITAYCTLDGFPVVGDIGEENQLARGSDYFTMFYSESGWLHMNCQLPHAYRDTGKYFYKILSLKEIQKKLLKALEKENGPASYGISDAQIGYAATEKKIRPAWILYGEKKSIGGGEGRYILDAVTGEVLTWEKSME